MKLNLEQLAEIARKATPGPWLNGYPNACKISSMPDHVWTMNKDLIAKDLIVEDATFIAAFNPQVCQELIERLQKARETLNEIAKHEANEDARTGREDLSYSGEIARKGLEEIDG